MTKRNGTATWVEYFLKNQARLKTLNPDQLRHFWAQREWHPVVRLCWQAGIDANGEGMTTYPDGTVHTYEIDKRK